VLSDGPEVSSMTAQLDLEGDTVALLGTEPVPVPGPTLLPPPPPPRPAPAPPSTPSPPPGGSTRLSPLEAFARFVIDAADPAAASRYLTPSFLGHGLILLDRGEGATDIATYRSLLGELFAAFAGFRTTFGVRFGEHDWIAASWTRTALHVGPYAGLPASRRSIEIRGVSIVRIERERIAEQWDVVDASWLSMIAGTEINALEPPD
jgi:predicted ester cyclase